MNNKSDYLRTLMLTTWEIYMHRKGEKKVKRRKGGVKSNEKRFVVKEKIGSAESFLRENDLSRDTRFHRAQQMS